MLFDSLDKLNRNSIMSSILLVALGAIILICPLKWIPSLVLVFGYVLFIGSCILASVDLEPKTTNGMPLIAVCGIIFSIALAIYSVGKLTKK